jgi:hypothetical protein
MPDDTDSRTPPMMHVVSQPQEPSKDTSKEVQDGQKGMLKNAPAPDPTAAMDPSKMMGPMVNQVYSLYTMYTVYCILCCFYCTLS